MLSRVSRKNRTVLRKNRKTRRSTQRGGGGQIDSIATWIKAVKDTPVFKATEGRFMKQPNAENIAFSLGEYTIIDLISEELKLPDRDTERDANGNFLRNDAFLFNPSTDINDFRDMATTIRDVLYDILKSDPTPYEFLGHIKDMKDIKDPNEQDSGILLSVQFAEKLEYKLKKMDDPNADILQHEILTNEKYYPLFILTLAANTDLDKERPLMMSEEDVANQLSEQQ